MVEMKNLTCYQIQERPARIIPARSDRPWMDATDERFAYRCLPLSIANAMGWEILLPTTISATWNGGNEIEDISVTIADASYDAHAIAASHFGFGTLTFHTGYLFRTDPGIGVWARGVPNRPKDGIAPLEGIIETDWLDFTFTMNWKFTRPGTVIFEKDEPFCFLTLIDYKALAGVVPVITPITEKPELHEGFDRWREARTDFNARLEAGEPEALRQRWQKWYTRGENGPGGEKAPNHVSKVRLAEPVRRSQADKTGK